MTRILTLTEAECLTLTVRGDVPGVLDGYIGPVQADDPNSPGAILNGVVVGTDPFDVAWADYVAGPLGMISKGRTLGRDVRGLLRLPLANPLVQAHLVGWLGRGERCPTCKGSRFQPGAAFDPDDPCSGCDGIGYLRPRFNRYPWLLPEAHGGLPDWIRLALIWGSVVRVAAGMEALRAAEPVPVSPRGPFTVGNAVAWWTATEERRGWFATRSNGVVLYPGWMWDTEHGPEIGAAALDRIYSCVMSQGFALIDNTPAGRVIRFEVPHDTP